MTAIQALIGFLTLVLGRQYYAVYVGAIAFMLTPVLINRFFPQQIASNILVTALLVGSVVG